MSRQPAHTFARALRCGHDCVIQAKGIRMSPASATEKRRAWMHALRVAAAWRNMARRALAEMQQIEGGER